MAKSDVEEEKSFGAKVWETVKTIFWALVIAGVFRTFLFQPFWIPSGSMKSTLLVGDFLFVNKMAYGYSYASCPSIRSIGLDADKFCWFWADKEDRVFGSLPERGDVVVFRHPVTGEDYIKRLVGMPGDTVAMQNGVLVINGSPVEMVREADFIETYEPQGPQGRFPACMGPRPEQGGECVKERYSETLPNGVTHDVLNIGNGGLDNVGVFTVPEGEYFFMGDNRDNSKDSRVPQSQTGVGFVPLKDIVGRADRIMFSSSGRSILAFWTWRSDRYFKAVE